MRPPPIRATLREARLGFEVARLVRHAPSLLRGDHAPSRSVIVLPGMLNSNVSTRALRAFLRSRGHRVEGWPLGRNMGEIRKDIVKVRQQLAATHARDESKVTLIGLSLGGIMARELAREFSGEVERVITVGTPVVGGPKYTCFAQVYRMVSAIDPDQIEAQLAAREENPIRVPITSIYSKRDGVVSWEASIDRRNPCVEHVEVDATHFGLMISPEVFRIIAAKLAQ